MARRRRIKVFWDYGAFPVWGGPSFGMLPPSRLAISVGLAQALQDWSDRCAALAWGPGPGGPGYEDPHVEEWEALDSEGLALSERLQAELGAGYAVAFEPHFESGPDG